MRLPLFPLNTLVCPGGNLPLRIFESRYMNMISRCLKEESGFVVVMLRQGDEVDGQKNMGMGQGTEGEAVKFYQLGTLAHIVDFDPGEAGMLNIVAKGEKRVRIQSPERDENGLWWGDVEALEAEALAPFPDEYTELNEVLRALMQHPLVEALKLEVDFDDCRQVGWRLTELLPLDNDEKQHLLELQDPVRRLELIADKLSAMSS